MMEERTITAVEHDYLESYFMWKAMIDGQPDLFAGLKYPINIGKWLNMMRTRGHVICPICKQIGSYSFINNNVEQIYKCLCNVASWTYQQDQMTAKWKDSYEQTDWTAIQATAKFGSVPGKTAQDAMNATQEAIKSLKDFTNGLMGWHLLRGTFGCGKSTMLKIVATQLAPISTYVTAGNLKNHFRVESGSNGDISGLIQAFSKVRILIIDDIGMEYDGSGFTTKTLRNIIDNRMAHPKKFPTLMSTNMSLDETQLLGGKNPDDTRAIVSRFLDPTYSTVHLLFQNDARRSSYQSTLKGGL